MIYIYTPSLSTGARDLAQTIREMGGKAKRIKKATAIKKGDLVVCWGHGAPPGLGNGAKFLNPKVLKDKKAEHLWLAEKGVSVPTVSSKPKVGFVGRSNNHQGGKDLLNGGGHDFWVEKIETTQEFRIHILGGVSIRAGMKVPRENYYPAGALTAKELKEKGGHILHPWVRSYDGGWRLSYGPSAQEHVRQSLRNAAKAAVAALGLDFGAVDVALLQGGGVVVWEVNKAPGLEGGSLKKYAEKLIQLAA